jgi:hypothetical protein
VLWLRSPGINIPQDWPSPGQYIDIRNENRLVRRDVDLAGPRRHADGLDEPQRVEGCETSSSLFRLLGAKPLHGRLLAPDEDAPGSRGRHPELTVLDARVRRDPNVVGTSITLNGSGRHRRRQEPVRGGRRARAGLPAERRDHADRREHPQMDVFLPLPFGADAVNRAATRTST